jgi:hypothetical protein
VDVRDEVKETSGEATNSMSKATICCLRMRRYLRRKSCASVGETRFEISVEPVTRDKVV